MDQATVAPDPAVISPMILAAFIHAAMVLAAWSRA